MSYNSFYKNLPFKNYLKDKQGTAAIEFTFWLAFIAVPLLMSLDFALYNISRSRLANTVSQASSLAFRERATADSDLTNQLEAIIKSGYKGNPEQISVSVTCNGVSSCTSEDRPSSCLSGFDDATGEPGFSSPGSNSECSNGTLPGYYMTLKVIAAYEEIIDGFIRS